MARLVCLARQGAENFADAIAIEGPQGPLSYVQLDSLVGELTAHLARQGVEPGSHLAAVGPTSLELVLLQLACIRLGAVFAPLSPRFPESQLIQLLDQIDARFLWHHQGVNLGGLASLSLENGLPPSDGKPLTRSQPVSLILTSGSSGHPKAAMHSLGNHLASASGSLAQIPLAPGDRWLASLPMYHIGGLALMFRCLDAGATLVLPRHRELLHNLRETRVSHLSLVATQLGWLLDARDSEALMAPLKLVLLGGGPIPQALLTRLSHYPIRALTSYGMTEMASQITTGAANDQGLSGTLLPGRELRIHQGIIEVRGETRFMGYYQDGSLNQPFDDQGWFHTKDRGEWHGEKLKVLGRADNMFISGGENVQPEEIEAALKQHPQIDEAVVLPVSDDTFGLLPVAVIRASTPQPGQQELDQFLAPRLARFKRPRRYLAWPENYAQQGLKVSREGLSAALREQLKPD
ncbi:o-succinylbenzoate--CoA ligase [Ferrimonas futtsuensis]|uniref:o-succinylbenzoate--CoA ligase n=1 Tax=Ferrimonas futtsuensis TaxID=364764 RepID=UPI0003FF7A80|nr:o-succinylbenzoate--CoA ligase [Ferrimonas futtsuensis]